MRAGLIVFAIAATSCASATVLRRIDGDASQLRKLMRSTPARDFLAGVARLPHPPTRVVYRSADRIRVYDSAAAAKLSASERAGLKRIDANEEFFYEGLWGSPLAYARPIEILATHGLQTLRGQRIVDFGYGDLGHLLLFAGAGAQAVGVDVDPLYPLLYGPLLAPNAATANARSVRIVDGSWPSAPARQNVGAPFDLFIAKNVLKRGYIHPERAAKPEQLIDLGVDDETFLRAVYDTLAPHGRMLIYNICPAMAPPDKDYIPWADGHSPFTREQYEHAGFSVIAIDVDDNPAMRAQARALSWDKGADAINPDKDLFAWWTLVERGQ